MANIEDTKKMILVMQAYVDGKSIECKPSTQEHYMRAGSPAWHFGAYNYRVKPEPREYWINSYPNETKLYLHESERLATLNIDKTGGKTIKVREVVE